MPAETLKRSKMSDEASKTGVRLDYYEITAADGDRELFKNKIEAVLGEVSEIDREFHVGTSSYNFNATIDADKKLIIGDIRDLRAIVPSKGRYGSNETTQIDLRGNEGISEKTYFIYDYRRNKLVISYNYHGPKIKHLLLLVNDTYKNKILSLTEPRVKFVRSSYQPYLLGREIQLALTNPVITCIEARTKTPVENNEISEDADWPELKDAYNLPPEVRKEVILKDTSGTTLAGVMRRFLRREQDIEYYDKFKVSMLNPYTNDIDAYDLISNKLQEQVSVTLKEGSKEIDSNDAIIVMKANLTAISDKYGW